MCLLHTGGFLMLLIVTDASSVSWGATCNGMKIGGKWLKIRSSYKLLGTSGLHHTLRAFCKDEHDLHIQMIKSDHICALTCIKKMGSNVFPLCKKLVKTIWTWATRKQICF